MNHDEMLAELAAVIARQSKRIHELEELEASRHLSRPPTPPDLFSKAIRDVEEAARENENARMYQDAVPRDDTADELRSTIPPQGDFVEEVTVESYRALAQNAEGFRLENEEMRAENERLRAEAWKQLIENDHLKETIDHLRQAQVDPLGAYTDEQLAVAFGESMPTEKMSYKGIAYGQTGEEMLLKHMAAFRERLAEK